MYVYVCLTTCLVPSDAQGLNADTHYADVTWDNVTSDAVSRVGLRELSAE
jgi:hypothetical protein